MTRKVVNRSPHREVGIVNAPWLLSHPVEHESHLERRFIMVALACPVVTDIVHQPETVVLTLSDGSEHRYTPDFLIRFADGTEVICEVKPEVFLLKTKDLRAAADALFGARNLHYVTVTDRQIDDNHRSARAILLMRFARLDFSPEQAAECKRLLEEEMAGSASISALVERGVSEGLIWNMVAKHALRTEIALNIGADEPIHLNEPMENCHDQFQRWFSAPAR